MYIAATSTWRTSTKLWWNTDRSLNLGQKYEELSVSPKIKFNSIVHHRDPKSVNTTLIYDVLQRPKVTEENIK